MSAFTVTAGALDHSAFGHGVNLSTTLAWCRYDVTIEATPAGKGARLLDPDVPVAEAIALGNHGGALFRDRGVAGGAEHKAVAQCRIAIEGTFPVVVIFMMAGEQLAAALFAVPGRTTPSGDLD